MLDIKLIRQNPDKVKEKMLENISGEFNSSIKFDF
jgi:seryl-tRNA synthetase